jgi:hypothetical protein
VIVQETGTLPFLPPTESGQSATRAGFRFGNKGTHSSRTMMLHELRAVLAATPADATRSEYAEAIVAGNCLGKQTTATRRLTNQRLAELYALDPACAVFRVLRRLWPLDEPGRPLLALLVAVARDPLLRATAPTVIVMAVGSELQRAALRQALREVVGGRFNDAVLDKIVRNVASSWAQAGHLQGRTFKVRRGVEATPASLAFALYLAHLAGFRGEDLLTSGWTAVLDCSPVAARSLALDAKRAGLIDLRAADHVLELGLDRLDTGSRRS